MMDDAASLWRLHQLPERQIRELQSITCVPNVREAGCTLFLFARTAGKQLCVRSKEKENEN